MELLIDANSVAYRSLFALEKLGIRLGEQRLVTGIAFGVLATVVQMRSKRRFSNITLFWDSPPYRKKQIYPEYKAKRKLNTDLSREEVELSRRFCVQLLRCAAVPQMHVPGEEADDVIASYAEASTDEVLILSSDKDLQQLLSPRIRILRQDKRGPSLWTATRFRAERKFDPEYFADYLAIVGDANDNIPGVKGVGQVSGDKIFTALPQPALKHIFTEPERFGLSAGIQKKLIAGERDAWFYYELVKLRTNLEPILMFDLVPDYKQLVRLLRKTKMKRFCDRQPLALLCGLE